MINLKKNIKSIFGKADLGIAATFPKMKLNPLTLSFSDDLEKQFQADYFNSSIGLLRISFLLGMIYYSIFAFLDVAVLPEVHIKLAIIRFSFVCPVILGVFILSFTREFSRWWQFAALLATVVSGFGIVLMTIISPALGRSTYYTGIILVLIYCYMLIKLRFVWASLAGWIIEFLYILSLIFFPLEDFSIVLVNLFFITSANILGMFGGYALEYYTRKDFYFRYLLKQEREKVQQANMELEEKVQEKTRELQEDIQRRKKIESDLRESEWQKDIILNSTSELFAYYDVDLKLLWANRASAESVGKKNEELIGKHCYELWQDRDKPCDGCIVLKAKETKRSQEGEMQTPDGRHWLLRGYPILGEKDDVIALVELGQEITEKKKAQEQIRNELKEKEILLRELYHRTKNNLQVISSMLHLRTLYMDNEEYIAIFKEMQNKILGMALVHQKLYESGDLSQLKLRSYLESLTKIIKNNMIAQDKNIDISIEGSDFPILLDTAMPIGIIINELTTNSIKYAFPKDTKGEIKIKIIGNEAKEITLEYFDNGVGLPENFDLKRDSGIGLQTVQDLVQYQLQGKIRFDSIPGFFCHIKLEEELYEARV